MFASGWSLSKDAHPSTLNGVFFGIWSSRAIESGPKKGTTPVPLMGSVLMLSGFFSQPGGLGYSVFKGCRNSM